MKKAIFTVIMFAFVAQVMLLAQQATFVSLYTLLRDWDSNKIRVKELYHNKTIQTAGEVSRVNADGSIVLSVEAMELWAMSMLGAGLRTTSISVNFNSSERSKLANLYKEQFINITGVNDGDRNVINRAVIGTAPATTAQPTPAPNNTEQARTANERGLAFFNEEPRGKPQGIFVG
jgi:hypothetical protein